MFEDPRHAPTVRNTGDVAENWPEPSLGQPLARMSGEGELVSLGARGLLRHALMISDEDSDINYLSKPENFVEIYQTR